MLLTDVWSNSVMEKKTSNDELLSDNKGFIVLLQTREEREATILYLTNSAIFDSTI